MNDLTVVDFHGDKIICVQDAVGNIWVAVRPMCTAIGISSQMQIKKIKSNPKYMSYVCIQHDASGRKQEMFCISLDNVEGWLMSINANRVKLAIRPKLIAYQKECMKALHDYWTHGQAINPRAPQGITNLAVADVAAFLNQLESMVEKKVDQAIGKAIEAHTALVNRELETQESLLRTQHGLRVVEVFKPIMVSGDEGYRNWAFSQLKLLVSDDMNPYTYFKLWTLFQDINPSLTKDQAQELATKFRKLDHIKPYAQGHVMENYGNDRVHMAIRYERKDWEDLRDLAIEWMRKEQYGEKQNLLFDPTT